MSKFAQLAMESADTLGYDNNAPFANGEETHTVANEIAEVQDLAQEAADEEAGAEQLDSEAEKTGELAEAVEQDVAAESVLDPTAAKFMRLAFKNIVGKEHANRTLPATESWEGNRSAARESTRIALEGIKDTLKSFWEAIKAQFKKVYNKVKDWMVKTFSAAKKLAERAKKIQQKANNTVGTIEEKSFNFSQTKAIAVNGKYSEAKALTDGLSLLSGIVDKTIDEMKKESVDGKIDDLVQAITNAVGTKTGKTRTVDNSKLEALKDAVSDAIKGATPGNNFSNVGNVDNYKKQFGDLNEVDVAAVVGLPGGKALIQVTVKTQASNIKDDDLKAAENYLKGNKLLVAADKYNPSEVSEGDVKTLTTSQIDKVCEDVIEIGEAIYSYEKSWASSDKYVERVQKEIDQMVKEFDQEDGADSTMQRHFRGFANAGIGAVRRFANFKANLNSYALSTANAFLNYAERSLAQHKSK